MTDALRDFIKSKGYDFEPTQLDGVPRDAKTNTCKVWYIGSVKDDLVSLTFEDYYTGERFSYFSKADVPAGVSDSIKKEHADKKHAKNIKTKGFISKLFTKWESVDRLPPNKYWDRKKLPRVQDIFFKMGDAGNCTLAVIPMRDILGEIWNVQYINDDGSKNFQPDARVKGLFFKIGHDLPENEFNPEIYVGEGVATCLSFHLATGKPVVAAFTASNISNVIEEFLNVGQSKDRVTVIADWDDKSGVANAGMIRAQEVFNKWGIECVIPGMPAGKSVDFSDLFVQDQIDPVYLTTKYGSEFFKEHDFIGNAKAHKAKPKERSGSVDVDPSPELVVGQGAQSTVECISRCPSSIDPDQPLALSRVEPDYSSIQKEIFPDQNSKKIPIPTIENFRVLMNQIGATLRYNIIKKEQEWILPGETASLDNKKNVIFARITDLCRRVGMPVGEIDPYLTYLCDQNQYNPVATWIESKPWDGVKRFKDFSGTIKSDDDALKETLIRKWMLSGIAAAYRPQGVMSPGVLVFRGNQGIGKTKWFKRLVPAELDLSADGKILRPEDKDSVKQAISYWLVELGELDATFKKSDIAQLKAFLTKDTDILRLPYARKECSYPRRTVFFGSVNNREFLADATGNRRFWVVECSEIDHEHSWDMQQVWAEILVAYRSGENWWLADGELSALNKSNRDFEMMDPIEEALRHRYNWTLPFKDGGWSKKHLEEVFKDLGMDKVGKMELNSCAASIRRLNGGIKDTKKNSLKAFWVAPISNVVHIKTHDVGDVPF